MKRFATLAVFLSIMLFADESCASLPVQVTITGCVKDGVLITEKTDFGAHASEGEYTIKPVTTDGKKVDLAVHEGKRITLSGSLLPGDTFYADTETLKVLGPCLPTPVSPSPERRSPEEQEKLAEELYSVMAKTDEWDIETFKKLHQRVIDECPDTEKAQESLWRLSNLYLLAVDPPDYQKIISLMELLISRYPDSVMVPSAKHRLILSYKETGNLKKVVELYGEAFSRYPEALDDPEVSAIVLDYAEALSKTGDEEKARELYRKVLSKEDRVEDWIRDIAKEGLASIGKSGTKDARSTQGTAATTAMMSEAEAQKLIWELPEIRKIADQVRAQGARPFTRVDGKPRAGAKPGSDDAAYMVYFGEDHETHVVNTMTFSVDGYSGAVKVYDIASDTYTRVEEWRRARSQ